ncbi:hypothetical protein HDV63DRAFT_10436 [Trichoderma sp. SZMC 28014]
MYMRPLFCTSTHVRTWVGERWLRKNACHPLPLFVLGRRCYHLVSTIVALYKRACASVSASAGDLSLLPFFFPFRKASFSMFPFFTLSGIARELPRSSSSLHEFTGWRINRDEKEGKNKQKEGNSVGHGELVICPASKRRLMPKRARGLTRLSSHLSN